VGFAERSWAQENRTKGYKFGIEDAFLSIARSTVVSAMPSFLDLAHAYKENGDRLAEARLSNNAPMISQCVMIKKMIETQIEDQQKLNRAFGCGIAVADIPSTEVDEADNP
jgi:hypothetical protein